MPFVQAFSQVFSKQRRSPKLFPVAPLSAPSVFLRSATMPVSLTAHSWKLSLRTGRYREDKSRLRYERIQRPQVGADSVFRLNTPNKTVA
jgi:hypothetical protein